MEAFAFMKECLKEFEYPNLYGLNDTQIAAIFNPPNRCFLISWLLKKIDDSYENIINNSVNEEFLGSLIYEQGFCTFKDKIPFIKGELPIMEQINILHRIFKYLKDISSSKESLLDDKTKVPVEMLFDVANKSLNLFPVYGKLKLLNDKDRAIKTKEYEEEINQLKNIEKTSTQDEVNKNFCEGKDDLQNDLFMKLEELKLDLPSVKDLIQAANKEKHNFQENFVLNANTNETMKKINENISIISKYVNDMNIVKEFMEHFPNIENMAIKSECINRDYEMIETLVKEIRKIRNS